MYNKINKQRDGIEALSKRRTFVLMGASQSDKSLLTFFLFLISFSLILFFNLSFLSSLPTSNMPEPTLVTGQWKLIYDDPNINSLIVNNEIRIISTSYDNSKCEAECKLKFGTTEDKCLEWGKSCIKQGEKCLKYDEKNPKLCLEYDCLEYSEVCILYDNREKEWEACLNSCKVGELPITFIDSKTSEQTSAGYLKDVDVSLKKDYQIKIGFGSDIYEWINNTFYVYPTGDYSRGAFEIEIYECDGTKLNYPDISWTEPTTNDDNSIVFNAQTLDTTERDCIKFKVNTFQTEADCLNGNQYTGCTANYDLRFTNFEDKNIITSRNITEVQGTFWYSFWDNFPFVWKAFSYNPQIEYYWLEYRGNITDLDPELILTYTLNSNLFKANGTVGTISGARPIASEAYFTFDNNEYTLGSYNYTNSSSINLADGRISNASYWELDAGVQYGWNDTGALNTIASFYDGEIYRMVSSDAVRTGIVGFQWNGTGWQYNATIKTGLVTGSGNQVITIFNLENTFRLISGNITGNYVGYDWNGNGWTPNTSVVRGLVDLGSGSTPNVYYQDGKYNMLTDSSFTGGVMTGFDWNGTSWNQNTSLVNGYVNIGRSIPMVWNDTETTYHLLVGNTDGNSIYYDWNGTGWFPDNTKNLPDVGDYSYPHVFYFNGWKVLVGENGGIPTGFSLSNYSRPTYLETGGVDGNGAYRFDGNTGYINTSSGERSLVTTIVLDYYNETSESWMKVVKFSNGSTYLDGVVSSFQVPVALYNKFIQIGKYDGMTYFNGTIDNVRIFPFLLSNQDILNLNNSLDVFGTYLNGADFKSYIYYNSTPTYWAFNFTFIEKYINQTIAPSGNANLTLRYRVATSYNATDSKIVGIWGLNNDTSIGETGLKFVDSTGRFNGTCSGAASCPIFTPNGTVDGAYKFDGTNDVINITINGTISYSVWTKTVITDPWRFVAYNGSTFFDNGYPTSTTFMNIFPINISGNRVKIGVNRTGKAYFNGWIDEVRFYNRSLNNNEILDLYEFGDMYFYNWSEWSNEELINNNSRIVTNKKNDFMQFEVNFNTNNTLYSDYLTNHVVYSYFIDEFSPLVNITSPYPNGTFYPSRYINVSVNVTETTNISTCLATIDNWETNYTMQPITPRRYNVTIDAVTEGLKELKIYCNDTLGYVNSSESIDFWVDANFPYFNNYNVNASSGLALNYYNFSTEVYDSFNVKSAWLSHDFDITGTTVENSSALNNANVALGGIYQAGQTFSSTSGGYMYQFCWIGRYNLGTKSNISVKIRTGNTQALELYNFTEISSDSVNVTQMQRCYNTTKPYYIQANVTYLVALSSINSSGSAYYWRRYSNTYPRGNQYSCSVSPCITWTSYAYDMTFRNSLGEFRYLNDTQLVNTTAKNISLTKQLKWGRDAPFTWSWCANDSSGKINCTETNSFYVYGLLGNGTVNDTTFPTGSIISPPNNTKVNGNVTINGFASDDSLQIVSMQYSNSSVAWTNLSGCANMPNPYDCVWNTAFFSDSAEGYKIRIVPCDASGNCNTTIETKTYFIDRNAPYDGATITYPIGQNSIRNGQIVVLRLNVTDGSGAGMNITRVDLTLLNGTGNSTMRLESGSLNAGQYSLWNISVTLTGTTTGEKDIRFYSYDNATPTNNIWSSYFPTIDVDNDNPTYNYLSISPEEPILNGTSVTFQVDAVDNYNLSHYIFARNFTGAWVNTTYNFTGLNPLNQIGEHIQTPLLAGRFGWRFILFDDAGNMNQSELQYLTITGTITTRYIVNSVSPADDSNITTNNVTFTYNYTTTGLNATTCNLFINGLLNKTTDNPPNSTNLNFQQNFSGGTYTWYVLCNRTGTSNFSEQRGFTLDYLPPNATLTNPPNGTTNNPNQNFSANLTDDVGIINATVYIYNETDLYNSTFFDSIYGSIETSVGIVVYLFDGIYNWFYEVFDIIGNTYTSENRTLTVDNTAPVCTLISRTPENMNDSSTGILNVMLNCTDLHGINITKTGDHYPFFITRTVDNFQVSEGMPNYWSVRYPNNSLSVTGTLTPQFKIWRALGRNEGYWYDSLTNTNLTDCTGITPCYKPLNDTFSYAIEDGDYGHLEVTNSSSTEYIINYTHPEVGIAGFRQVVYISWESMVHELKKNQTVNKNNYVLVKGFDPEAYRSIKNYTASLYANLEVVGSPSKELNMYYCNFSYNPNGAVSPTTSPFCTLANSLTSTEVNQKQFTEVNSTYNKGVFGVVNGRYGGVTTTGEYYLVFQSEQTAVGSYYQIRYANESTNTNVRFNDTKTVWSSTNQGTTWTQQNWTADLFTTFVRSANDEFQFGYYVVDNYGNAGYNFTLFKDEITKTNNPISFPAIIDYNSTGGGLDMDLNRTHNGLMQIRVGVSTDPDSVGNVTHNLSLMNPDGSFNKTINGSFVSYDDSDLWVNFDSTSVPDGQYRMNIFAQSGDNVLDNKNRTTNSNFTIDNTRPSVTGLTEDPAEPQEYSAVRRYEFNATITDLNGVNAVKFRFAGTDYTPTKNGDVYNYSLVGLGVFTYTYSWIANDTVNNINNTEGGTYQVVPVNNNPVFSNCRDFNHPIGTPFSQTISASDENGIDSYTFQDSTNFVVNPSTGLITNVTSMQTIALYYLNLTVNDTTNKKAECIFNINVGAFIPAVSGGTAESCRYKKLGYYNTKLVWLKQENCL